jgi:SWI/SNF-related matrix-associated actin-dependent regulator 1 of chromatin subfamily A
MPDLLPHQAKGVLWLLAHPKSILADAPGFGKTAQALGVVRAVAAYLGDVRSLVICPAHLRTNWRREAEMWNVAGGIVVCGKGSPPGEALSICSYEYAAKNAAMLKGFDIVITDEAHYLKEPGAARTKAILGERAKGVDCVVAVALYDLRLTGTPTPNHPGEIYSQMRSLAPETLIHKGKVMSKTTFVQRFCKTRDIGYGPQPYAGKSKGMMEELRGRLAPILLRRTSGVKRPPVGLIYLDANAAGESLLKSIDPGAMVKVRKALESGGLDGLKGVVDHVATLRRLIGEAKVAPFAQHLTDQLNQGGKYVVFAHHRSVIEALAVAVEKVDVKVRVMKGGLSDTTKQRAVDDFQTDPKVRVIICQNNINTGYTLTASQTLYYLEPSWVPSDNEQMAARIDRIGQEGKVQFRMAALANTIDEDIVRALAVKLKSLKELYG